MTIVAGGVEQRLERLIADGVETLSTTALLERMIHRELAGRIAVVSSFGAESAVLLHLVADIAPETPVLFVDTDKLFGETRRYKAQLVARLGLRDVREIRPDPAAVAARDPDGTLWARDPDACCALRKVEPLERALASFDGWINGRKRYQGTTRSNLPVIERDGRRLKLNPLANWTKADIDGYRAVHDLPVHPLVEDGYLSIGCMPCSDRVAAGEDERAGRWRGLGKTECGIHRPANFQSQG